VAPRSCDAINHQEIAHGAPLGIRIAFRVALEARQLEAEVRDRRPQLIGDTRFRH
jgi:hypothetical protein